MRPVEKFLIILLLLMSSISLASSDAIEEEEYETLHHTFFGYQSLSQGLFNEKLNELYLVRLGPKNLEADSRHIGCRAKPTTKHLQEFLVRSAAHVGSRYFGIPIASICIHALEIQGEKSYRVELVHTEGNLIAYMKARPVAIDGDKTHEYFIYRESNTDDDSMARIVAEVRPELSVLRDIGNFLRGRSYVYDVVPRGSWSQKLRSLGYYDNLNFSGRYGFFDYYSLDAPKKLLQSESVAEEIRVHGKKPLLFSRYDLLKGDFVAHRYIKIDGEGLPVQRDTLILLSAIPYMNQVFKRSM